MKAKYKMHQQPGDYGVSTKAAMLEGKYPDKKQSKSFKKMHLARERAVLKERTLEEIENELETNEFVGGD